ncbi:hypothetical protein QBC35DRAFT_496667 [Podospora australis]|uniref:Fatty acid hydroxylase domain-containing protein n=1 Tax=Podospora australis TaxID=1536484 RepID=A0AAN6WU85_9PEZI|nr:hypothetical protein QBC35DRAFT_496667 [Podospora australis]
MDLLLSLPIVSYFFTTSLTSWSTSLNLLFFYMTWSTLVLSHSPLKIEIIGTTAIRLVLWLLPSLVFLAFDSLLPSLSETVKFNGASALPPRDARSLSKLLGLALFNLALESALEATISLGLATVFKTPVFRTSTTLPLPWQMIKQLLWLFAGREVLSYYIHRQLLHNKPAPPSLRKAAETTKKVTSKLPKVKARKGVGVHTSVPSRRRLASLHSNHCHASRSPPFSLRVKTDHPLSYLLHHFLPIYLPALALHFWTATSPSSGLGFSSFSFGLGGLSNITSTGGLHILTYLVFLALCTAEETLSHSGYTVIPGIFLGGICRRTAAHFAQPDRGNFGSWGILDWIHGTSLGGKNVWDDVKGEAEKHRLQERGEEKANGAIGAVREGIRRSARQRSSRSRRRVVEESDEDWSEE